MLATLRVLAFVAVLLAANVAARATTHTIVLDISPSVPLISDQAQADSASRYTQRALKNLKLGDVVSIRALGDYGLNRNWGLTVTVSRRNKPHNVAKAFARLVAAVPQLVSSQKVRLNSTTNILAFLEDNASRFGCGSGGGRVLVFSDAVENSELVKARTLVSGKAKPKQIIPGLEGCSFVFLGIGHVKKGGSVRVTRRLKKFWSTFFKINGAQFQAVPQF